MGVWDHFTVKSNTASDNKKAVCKHCATVISYSAKSSSNLATHLKRKHREATIQTAPVTSSAGPSAAESQTSLTAFATPTKKYRVITNALIMFIAGDLMPLSTVESPNFRTLVEALDQRYSIPSCRHFTSVLLRNKASQTSDPLKSHLQQAQSVCLTLDLWSSRQMRGFIGVTGHYVLNWTLQSVMLACSRFKGRHTSENIAQAVDETVACFEIGAKITNITTDNASNMVKAFSLPGFKDVDVDDDGVAEDDNSDGEAVEPVDIKDDLHADHESCFAHTLNLVVKDGLKEGGFWGKILSKTATIVAHVRRSTKASDIMEGATRLQTANSTRWNSQLHMIRSILKAPEELLQQLDCAQLTKYERKTLVEMQEILLPFETATMLIQGQNCVTSSWVVPTVRGMKVQLEKMADKYACKLMTALRTSFLRRMAVYESKEVFLLSTALDPRFKLKWCMGEELQSLKSTLARKAATVKVDCQPSSQPDTDTTKRAKLDQDIEFLDFFMQPDTSSNTIISHLDSEIHTYLEESVLGKGKDPLAYWQTNDMKFPHLAALAVKYLAVPASSAAVERLFSIGGKIFRPERCRLSDNVFEQLMFVQQPH